MLAILNEDMFSASDHLMTTVSDKNCVSSMCTATC